MSATVGGETEPNGVEPPAEAALLDADAPLFPHQSLWRLSVLSLVTFSLYGVAWAYRAGKALRARGQESAHPFWWGAGMVVPFPLFSAFVLRRLAAYNRRDAHARGIEMRSIGAALIGLGVIHVALAFTIKLTATVIPIEVAALLPLLLLQRQINQGWATSTPNPAFTWRQRITVALGGCLALVFLWWVDLPKVRSLIRRAGAEHLAQGAPIFGDSSVFSLTPPSIDWIRAPAGTHGGKDTDLELEHKNGESFIVSYVLHSASLTIDTVVDERRAKVEKESMALTKERRTLSGDSLVPLSIAQFESQDRLGPHWLVIATSRGANGVVEVLGFAATKDIVEVQRLVESLALRDEEKAP